MSSTAIENIRELERFTHCYCFVFDVRYHTVKQNVDTQDTFYCTFLASEILEIDHWIIADYYKMNRAYMKGKFLDTKLRREMDDVLLVKMEQVRNLWKLMLNNEVVYEG